MHDCYVFSIEEFATFDGPGIRTTVFLKGCPLRCVWCHNPEGQRPGPEYVRSAAGCTGCRACERAAGRDKNGAPVLSAQSAEACPRGLVRPCGKAYTPDALAALVLKKRLPTEGGVTFSGGEPLIHTDFLTECMAKLQGKIHIAVQTSGYAPEADFMRILAAADYFLFDLKLADPEKHRRYCGADNAPILRNYRILVRSGKPFVTRIPLIPGATDTEENLSALAAILRDLDVKYAETLPYNRFAGSKYASVLRTYTPPFDETAEVRPGEDIFARYGITAKRM